MMRLPYAYPFDLSKEIVSPCWTSLGPKAEKASPVIKAKKASPGHSHGALEGLFASLPDYLPSSSSRFCKRVTRADLG
jgi:hypothetical protein